MIKRGSLTLICYKKMKHETLHTLCGNRIVLPSYRALITPTQLIYTPRYTHKTTSSRLLPGVESGILSFRQYGKVLSQNTIIPFDFVYIPSRPLILFTIISSKSSKYSVKYISDDMSGAPLLSLTVYVVFWDKKFTMNNKFIFWFIWQADNLRQQTLQQMHRILTTRQSARAILTIHDYFSRLRALSSLWLARPREWQCFDLLSINQK